MTKQITLTIDNQVITAPEGMLIVDAAKQAGVNIPVFCYHPKMEPVGMCRMCLVDVGRPMVDRATGQTVLDADGRPKIGFGPKLETACTTPVSEGMVVITESEKVKTARKDVLEKLRTSIGNRTW
ncbi:MAG TPA: 2Fe-2S iron-sulfur cluster-binding protein, partial [Anaerolineaceae bacterium]|nr:2Fe-2S iron-sulfur cluster-binding protein [Anaerolineaceae bacterium]